MEACFPFEDSSPENRELAKIVRQLGELLPSGPEVDWQELRGRCGNVLREIIHGSDTSRRLTQLLTGQEYFVGGDEHHIIRVSADADRVYKFTHDDNFGCRSYFCPVDPELIGHFHGETNADPFFYLTRWGLLNSITDYQTRFEGFVHSERPGWLPRICVSQPALPLENPTPEQIRKALAKYGFREISTAAFFQPETHVLLTDAAPRNVRIVDGIPIPFDAIAQIVSGRLLAWAIERSG